MLVALVALLVFGPRKIPELARKAGKIMQELRQVSNEFRSTWEREVNLDDDEKKAFDFNDLTREPQTIAPPVAESVLESEEKGENDKQESESPEVREISDPETLDQLKSQATPAPEESTDKQNWL